jgi:uncharacterized repeat protein (TIGR02543 family)
VTVTANSANVSPTPRSATVTVSATGATDQTVTVTQAGTVTLSVAPSTVSLAAASGSNGTFNITSNTSWTISDNGSWLDVSPVSGSNNAPVTVTANSANVSPTPRSATVTVSATGATDQTVTVTQAGAAAYLNLSTTTVSVAAAANSTGTFNITSNTSWTVISNQTWLTVSAASGSDNATITVTAEANSSASSRIAAVNVTGNGLSPQTVTITQAGIPTYSISLSANPAAGGSTSGGGTYSSGASVTVNATPAIGYTFVNWTEDATVVSTNASYTFTVSANRTLVANFSQTSVIQTVSLTLGWNILSFAVEPNNMSMMAIVDPLISAGTLIKVQDEKGNAIEKLPDPIGWINNIGQMSLSEGYKIRVTGNTQINLTGNPLSSLYNISLEAGWNIIGYPFMSSQPALATFQPLINAGSLIKVQDEQGNAIEKLPDPIGWIDNIHNLNPGNGYKVRTSINTTLTINNTGKGEYQVEDALVTQPTHFKPVYSGNGLDHMNIYLKNPTAGGLGLKSRDEIGVFDSGRCVGAAVVNDLNTEYFPVIVSFDDPTTQEADGFREGNPFEIRLWDSYTGMERKTQNMDSDKGYNMLFERLGTTVLKVDFEEVARSFLGDAYPNPSYDKTTFTYQLVRECKVRLEIFNVRGDLVKVLVNQNMPEGSHEIEWGNQTASGNKAKAGFYFIKLSFSDFSQTKQLIIH